jgi:hypothetical protein
MGFFADFYLIYAFKILTRWVKFHGSGGWKTTVATVTAAPIASSAAWGCRTVEIPYAYRLDGELYTGLHEEPFLLNDSLIEYAERFREGSKFVIRVKPDSSEISTVREDDQTASVSRP